MVKQSKKTKTRSGASGDSDGKPRIRIGTSGWSYDGWRGMLYPKKLPKNDWLRYYGSHFSSAEINSSFYRTPSLEAVRSWRRDTPGDFTFAWKASKFITHWKRLLPTCENSIALMRTRFRLLGPKLGIVLFQLPHRFRKDTEPLLWMPACSRPCVHDLGGCNDFKAKRRSGSRSSWQKLRCPDDKVRT